MGLRVCVDCHRLTSGVRCVEHQRAVSGDGRLQRETGSAASRGYDADWRRVRDQVLVSEPFCRRCGALDPPSLTLAIDVDHIVPMSQGGARLDLGNLQPLCRACHRIKSVEDRYRRGAIA